MAKYLLSLKLIVLVFFCIIHSDKVVAKAVQNAGAEYDKDFKSGQESLYNKRFGPVRYIPREESAIIESFKSTFSLTKNKKHMSILDFGCGDGRMLPILINLASKYNKTAIDVYAYDLSIIGLEEFQKNLIGNNFYKIEANGLLNTKLDILGVWQRENLRLTLIHGTDTIDRFPEDIIDRKFDLIYAMFSVICHIDGRVNRINQIKQLGNIMADHGEMIINVSTPISLPEEVNAYGLIRKQRHLALKHQDFKIASLLERTLRLATEPGDIYYTKEDRANYTHSFGHAYTGEELRHDVESAFLTCSSVKIMSIAQPYIVSKNWIKKYSDTFLSMILSLDLPFYPFKDKDRISKNIYIVAKKQ